MEGVEKRVVDLDEGWQFVSAGVAKVRCTVEADGELRVSVNEYLELYTMVYDMCTQKPPGPPHYYPRQLYQLYQEDVDNYMKSTVLPPLREMQGELLLRALVESWRKQNLIAKFGAKVFRYLESYYIPRAMLPPLREVSIASFREMVFNKLKSTVTTTVIGMIYDEREGKRIDQDLLKNVLDIFVQIGLGNHINRNHIYQEDFEQTFLKGTKNYYVRKAQTWKKEYSDHDYMLKVEECLQKEKERVKHYLHSSTEPKLMEAARSMLNKGTQS